jgi:hypothetical protein
MSRPDLYIFNPTSEMAIANNSISYMPPERLQLFEQDLTPIMLWLAKPSDLILCHQHPDNTWLKELQRANIETPRFITLQELKKENIQINEIIPWGWNPTIIRQIATLKPQCDNNFNESVNVNWKPEKRAFFSRFTSIKLIEHLNTFLPQQYIQISHQPQTANTIEEAIALLEIFQGKAVFKAPWSSSGRGLMMVDAIIGKPLNKQWLQGMIRQQGAVTVEPLLNKLTDLSFHFRVHSSGNIDYIGHTFFNTDNTGKFKGCLLEAYPDTVFSQPWADGLKEAIEWVQEPLKKALISLNLHHCYTGPLGVDALWHHTADGNFLHPALELNIRHTMGLVNIMMREKLVNIKQGEWHIQQLNPSHNNDTSINNSPDVLFLTPSSAQFQAILKYTQ